MPCFLNSLSYHRAVGYFSSSSLSLAAKGIHAFIKSGGKMQLIASPYLSQQDIHDISKGYLLRREAEERALLSVLESEYDEITAHRLALLAWLIEHERLDIKIAVVKGRSRYGIYHEKLGIFADGRDCLAFTGSPNESQSGLVSNFENIDVFASWLPKDEDRVAEKLTNFKNLWDDNTRFLDVYPFPEAARRSLLKRTIAIVPNRDPEEGPPSVPVYVDIPKGCPTLPPNLKLRPYQRKAIDAWLAAKKQGTMMMATGSGKTITALSLIEHEYFNSDLQAALIIAPYKHLISQWAAEATLFGLEPLCCLEAQAKWSNLLEANLSVLKAGGIGFLTVISTNNTFMSPRFQSILSYFPTNTLIIADESHNLGSPKMLSLLPHRFPFRLALSATPEKWFDVDATKHLCDYFGKVVFEFTLRQGIQHGALVPYRYYPHFVNLTHDESERFLALSKRLATAMQSKPSQQDADYPSMLLYERARLVASAHNKLGILRKLMQSRLDTTHTLFYCGDGSVETESTSDIQRQVDMVARILGSELHFRIAKYTAEVPLTDRDELKIKIDNGDLQGLVAIRCLDEGIDIPSIRTAFILASSSNPRQFIQRRGRVLRPFPGKTEAEIFDMIVLPPKESLASYESERTLIKKELNRCLQFGDAAINAGVVRGIIADVEAKFRLT